ncbi:hypothetical protein LOK49_LG01G00013 [Camellia lanceoleosa]|uniref:Uncharacterized protein n=1 Tax=Camellia lanceoleosa TaxID=1840588 RepID=A0ACC0J6S2_9ERIC|nr:hypothetical protein LOK49_LG01G00013 [Camellia lanceoleosa]
MASVGEKDNDAVLSDIEADDLVPISIKSPEDLTEGLTGEVRRLVERERQRRCERKSPNRHPPSSLPVDLGYCMGEAINVLKL